MDDETSNRDQGHDELKDALQKLFSSKENADLDIVCCGNVFRCHSFLLWTRSKFFAAACKGGFKEGITNRIEFPEDDPQWIANLIRYVYLSDYSDTESGYKVDQEIHSTSKLHTNAGMYALGEKYDLPGLKKLAGLKFDIALTCFAIHPTALFSLIHLVYNSTPEADRGMRDRILNYARARPKYFTSWGGFKGMVPDNVDFVTELISRTLALKPPAPYNGKCGRCKATDKWKADHVTCSCGWGERC